LLDKQRLIVDTLAPELGARCRDFSLRLEWVQGRNTRQITDECVAFCAIGELVRI
jgi:hypothetical protein